MNRALVHSPWGVLVAVYLAIAGGIAGLALLAPWLGPHPVRTRHAFDLSVNRATIALYVVGTGCLVVDLGRPLRAYRMLTGFNAASPIAYGTRVLLVEGFLLVVWRLLLRRRSAALARGDLELTGTATRALYWLVPAAVTVAGGLLTLYPGWLVSRVWMSPWRGASAYGLFIGTTLLMGAAGCVLAGATVERVRAVVAAGLVLALLPTLRAPTSLASVTIGVAVVGAVPLAARVTTARAWLAVATAAVARSAWLLLAGRIS